MSDTKIAIVFEPPFKAGGTMLSGVDSARHGPFAFHPVGVSFTAADGERCTAPWHIVQGVKGWEPSTRPPEASALPAKKAG